MTEPLRMRNVLFATDFSDASRAAGESAAAFARHFGARRTYSTSCRRSPIRRRRRGPSGPWPPSSNRG
jgi:hypothetical protein